MIADGFGSALAPTIRSSRSSCSTTARRRHRSRRRSPPPQVIRAAKCSAIPSTAARRSSSTSVSRRPATSSSSSRTPTRTCHPEALQAPGRADGPVAAGRGGAGAPHVTNRGRLIRAMQVLEAASIIGLIRRTQSLTGRVGVVAGVLGIFRRERVLAVGGYDSRMATEDIDLTWRLISPAGTRRTSRTRWSGCRSRRRSRRCGRSASAGRAVRARCSTSISDR